MAAKAEDVAYGYPAEIAKNLFPNKKDPYCYENRATVRSLVAILDRRYGFRDNFIEPREEDT